MVKRNFILLLIFLHFCFYPSIAHAEFESIYHYYIEEGVEAFYKGDFENAIFYFKTARAIDPSRQQPGQFLNLIKRVQEGRLKDPTTSSDNVVRKQINEILTETSSEKTAQTAQTIPAIENQQASNSFAPHEAKISKYIPSNSPNNEPNKLTGAFMPQTERSFTIIEPKNRLRHLANDEEVRLNDELWAQQQSNLTIEMEIGKSTIFVAKNIAKYLITSQDILEITRLDQDRVRVKAVRRGNTILYIWDDKGRWTFNIRSEYGFEALNPERKQLNEEQSKPFRMGYTNNWNTYHKGKDLGGMTRQSLIFTNWLGISGETPYGYFDASANSNMFPNSTEIVGQRIGLSDAQIGPFKDFTLRGYDTYKELSDLTLAGRYFRGFLINAYAFEHKIAYSYFKGQDQSTTLYTTDTTFTRQQSFIEGFKLKLYPDQPDNYSFNYAHGYGSARPAGYKNEVYSVETKQKMHEWDMHGEIGYDRDVFSGLADWKLNREDLDMNFSLKDIEKGYQTVYGTPSNAGLISGAWNMAITKKEFQFSSFVDIYRDRVLPNPQHPDLVNIDLSTSVSKPLTDTSSVGASLAYTYTPQVISPRQFAQESTNYTKNYKIGLRYLSLSLGQTWQWSRNEVSPSSDYDRFSLRAGFRMQLIQYLYYSMNYDYIWVRDVFTDTTSMPSAVQSGLSYNIPLTEHVYFGADLNYRKEQQSKSTFSFLAGEDSLSNTLSLTYKPNTDLEIFTDSQLRKVWAHNNINTPRYIDWNLTVGMRAGWDMPFHWSPTGEIRGIVYKDYNGNSFQDKNEPGMPNIKVIAGKYETLTNDDGEYLIKVQAKKTTVGLDLKSIPQGFVFSTALSREVIIEHKKAVNVNFGLTSRSGIYGIAYVDLNGSGKPDRGDKFMSNVVVRLDGNEITKTDQAGSYFFENINPGTHKIRINVNSINIRYSPTIKIETQVEVEEGMTYVHNIPLKENPEVIKP